MLYCVVIGTKIDIHITIYTNILSDDEAHGVELDLVLGLLETVMDGLKELLRVRVRQMLLKRLLCIVIRSGYIVTMQLIATLTYYDQVDNTTL